MLPASFQVPAAIVLLAGGLIVGYFHWRVIFFVNLPIGLLGFALVLRRFPDYRTERVERLDVLGGVVIGCAALAAMVLVSRATGLAQVDRDGS